MKSMSSSIARQAFARPRIVILRDERFVIVRYRGPIAAIVGIRRRQHAY
jgi:hypothetical protein